MTRVFGVHDSAGPMGTSAKPLVGTLCRPWRLAKRWMPSGAAGKP